MSRNIDPRITAAISEACIEHRRDLQIRWDLELAHNEHGTALVRFGIVAGERRRANRLQRFMLRWFAWAGYRFRTGEWRVWGDVRADLFDNLGEYRARATIFQAVAIAIAELRGRLDNAKRWGLI